MTKAIWKKIDSERVRLTWDCPICHDRVKVPPTFFQESGVPMCGDCGDDMEFICTEIKEDKK